MLPGEPFGAAERKARATGTCPVWSLDDFYADHWDFGALCLQFGCGECVADPEDMGPTEPPAPVTWDERSDLPF